MLPASVSKLKNTWFQFLGISGGERFYMFLGTDQDVDPDKISEISRNLPTKKILKKVGVPQDLARDCLNAVASVKESTFP